MARPSHDLDIIRGTFLAPDQTMRVPRPSVVRSVVAALALCALPLAFTGAAPAAAGRTAIISIVGTSDLHGYFMPRGGRGGIGVFAGYVRNLRAARHADGGAVLLLDAGDTFQGGVESDLSEGAVVVDEIGRAHV